ncbi:hypothetical protein C8R45DRAFT_931626 [Mycena sanguinolenta]|nr:hypothetical protein C8R45DRAFT_931626 [Mycena sanguinolenta]
MNTQKLRLHIGHEGRISFWLLVSGVSQREMHINQLRVLVTRGMPVDRHIIVVFPYYETPQNLHPRTDHGNSRYADNHYPQQLFVEHTPLRCSMSRENIPVKPMCRAPLVNGNVDPEFKVPQSREQKGVKGVAELDLENLECGCTRCEEHISQWHGTTVLEGKRDPTSTSIGAASNEVPGKHSWTGTGKERCGGEGDEGKEQRKRPTSLCKSCAV